VQKNRRPVCRLNGKSCMGNGCFALVRRMAAKAWGALICSHLNLHDVLGTEPLVQLWAVYSPRGSVSYKGSFVHRFETPRLTEGGADA
jgi:hypothetical protein